MTRLEKIKEIEEFGNEMGEVLTGCFLSDKECYGVKCDDAVAVIEEAAFRGIRGAKIMSLSRSHVVHWPDVTVAKCRKRKNGLR